MGAARDALDAATVAPAGFEAWAGIVSDGVDQGGLVHAYGSGLWYAPPMGVTLQNQQNSVGDVRLFRWDFPPGTMCTGLGIAVNTGGAAGATKTLLIYNDNGTSSFPTTLQKATSALATTTSGVKSETFTAEDVSGVRWIGTLTLTNTCQCVGISSGVPGVGAATITAASSVWTGYIQTGQTSAPGTFTSTRTPVNGMDRVFVQIG